MPPTTPYSTSKQAAYLLKTMFRNTRPGPSTPVTDEEFTQMIQWCDSVIDMNFSSVGYIVPFATLSGETWPTHQTNWTAYLSAVSAAAMAGGYILAPAPAMMPSQVRGGQNIYASMINQFFVSIGKHGYHFRAQYYRGTKAEKWLTTPQGPRTDFMSDYLDPTRYELLSAYTDRIVELFGDVGDLDIEWDYLYSLRSVSAS
jgi:hypothetical protein